MKITTYNPHNGEVLNEYSKHSTEQASNIVERAFDAFINWKQLKYSEKAELMLKAAEVLTQRCNSYAELMALEMGKPITQGIAEIKKCISVCKYYAEFTEQILSPRFVKTEAKKSYVTYNPLGIVLAIMPWNFPFWQVFRFAAPHLCAGNIGLLKHSTNTTGCSLAIEELFREAGFPDGVFSSLLISGSEAEQLISHSKIAAVTLTGSTPVGKKVAAAAGAELKKCVVELGGSDPYIVLKSADIKHAAKVCAAGRLINSGQSCIAAKRFIVDKEVYNDFVEAFVQEMKSYKMGDPLQVETQVGPQARKDLVQEHYEQVSLSIDKGGKLLLGGEIPESNGYYFPPTVIADVTPGMPVFDDETFGPVAAVTCANSEKEAIELANRTPFGLGAAVFSEDIERAEEIASKLIDAGSVFINGNVKSDPRMPFGGIKESGFGRELSEEGIKEFVNIKTVVIE